MNRWKNFAKVLLEILFIFGICFLYQSYKNVENYFHDAAHYMALAQSFWQEGEFSLRHFSMSLRGVNFPLLISFFYFFCLKFGLNRVWAWRVTSSLLAAVLIYVFPYLLTQKTAKELHGLRKKRLLLLFLILFFWSGLLLYPLSDFAAVCFLVVGMVMALGKDREGFISYARCFFSGMCFYIAYNTRTIYLFPMLFFVISWLCLVKEKPRRKAWKLLFFAGGLFAAAVPQIIVNGYAYGTFTPMVITDNGGAANGLFSWQIGMGLRIAEYETYIGDLQIFPSPSVIFLEPAGTMLLTEAGLNEATIQIKDIFWLFLHYPLDILGIYMRHFIHMLNPLWGEVYITDLYGCKLHKMLLNYVLLVIGFTYARTVKLPEKPWTLFKDEVWRKKFLVYATMLVPCLMILPGAVELRFFFPMYVLFYGFLFFEMGTDGLKQVGRVWKAHPFYCAILSFVVFASLLAVWGNTYAGLQSSPRWLKLE